MQVRLQAASLLLLGVCLLGSTQSEAGSPAAGTDGAIQFAAYEEEQEVSAVAYPPAPIPADRLARVSTWGEPQQPSEVPSNEPLDLGGAVDMVEAPTEAAAQAWHIPQPQVFQRWGINMGGWVQQGITGNATDPADNFNGPLATNDRSGEYQLNQAWMYFVRPTKTDGCGFDLGGRIDMAYGTDWRFGMNQGLEDRIDSPNQLYGLVLPQFYLEAALNNLTVKMGHWATGMGYEMVPAVGNFFYSHNYLMSYTEPLLVTGIVADYKLNDRWTAVAGLHRGWMVFEDSNTDWDYITGFRWMSDDKRTGLSLLLDGGEETNFFGVDHYRTVYAMVLTHKFTEALNYAFQYNHGWEYGGALPATGADAQWYGICQWLTYALNPKLSLGGRVEWFRDNNGDRVAGVGGWIGSDRGWQGAPGFAGNFYEVTVGLNWRPHSNVVIRPEIRYDWYDGTTNLADQLPFGGGTRTDQLTYAVDLVTTF